MLEIRNKEVQELIGNKVSEQQKEAEIRDLPKLIDIMVTFARAACGNIRILNSDISIQRNLTF